MREVVKKKGVKERNADVYRILGEIFAEAEKDDSVDVYFRSINKDMMDRLFDSKVWGYREVLITAIMGRCVDLDFKPSKGFYKCSPRALYEWPVREVLRNYKIPHKKSGPLNVAKASNLNSSWARQKREGQIAKDVVLAVRVIDTLTQDELKTLGITFARYFLAEARTSQSYNIVDIPPQIHPLQISQLCNVLIQEVPNGGATPQRIVGLLIEAYQSERGWTTEIEWIYDSVSTTNTTSKKAWDIVEKVNGLSLSIYEVTVKAFTLDRMRESYESIHDCEYSSKAREVYVICRPIDVPDFVTTTTGHPILLGWYQYHELTYWFINIFSWIETKVILTTPIWRSRFVEQLTEYINDTNTPVEVKQVYRNLLDGNA